MGGRITALERTRLRPDSSQSTADAAPEISPATESVLADEQARIKVPMMPDAPPGNPYQWQLAEALQRRGGRVELANPAGALPLLISAVAKQAPIRVLHLHWTHRLTVSDSRLKSVLKGIRLIMELAWLRLHGIRLVWTAHKLLEHEQRHPRLELFFGRIAERLVAPSAGRLIAGRPWDDATADRLRVRARRNPRIHLYLDFIPDAEVQTNLNAADVVVLPYRGVRTCGSAMLAMSLGRAVVMPHCGCAEEMLAGEHNRKRAERFGWDAIAWLTEGVYQGQRAP